MLIKKISLIIIFLKFHLKPNYRWEHHILAAILLPMMTYGQQQTNPWLETIAAKVNVHEIATISSQAKVTVSDGLTYKTHTVFHDAQRAIFQRIYKDRSMVQGVEGKYVWSFDGSVEKEVSEFVGNVVLGHQFHAQILFFHKLHPALDIPKPSEFIGQDCHVLSCEKSGFKMYYKQSGYPLGMEIVRKEEENIVFKFEDWRLVSGIDLPFVILINDGQRIFRYEFGDVKFNGSSIAEFKAPESVLTEKQKLFRHHRVIMDGHFFGSTYEMKEQQNDTMAIVSEGEIYMIPGNQPNAMIDRIMSSRDYTVYDDLIRPKIAISDDGTMGWVIAQIYAEGIRYDDDRNPIGPLEFTCSWIELYEKVNDKWKMCGNVSNFKPGME